MSLFGRAAAILLKPRRTWPAIAAERRSGPVVAHVALLALLPALAVFLRQSRLGAAWPATPSAEWAAGAALWPALSYLGGVLAVAALTLVVDALAPLFGTRRHLAATLRLVGYASTAAAVGCLVLAAPLPAWLALAGALYAVYLFHSGLVPLLKAPPGRTLAYTAAVVLGATLVAAAVGAVVARWAPVSVGPSWASPEQAPEPLAFDRTTVPAIAEQMEATSRRIAEAARASGEASVPGRAAAVSGVSAASATLATSAASAASASPAAAPASAARDAARAGAPPAASSAIPAAPLAPGSAALAAAALRAALPETLHDWRRESLVAREARPDASLLAWARARYASGERRIDVSVADLGGPVVSADMRLRPHVELHKQTAGQIEANYNDGQRAIRELATADGQRVTFTVILANGVMVELQGQRLPMPMLKALYGGLDIARLEALARTRQR